jgi:hypothetical protein
MELTGGIQTVGRRTRLRLSSLLVAFALVAGSLLLIQQQAEAAPSPVAAAVVVPADAAQLPNFNAIVCAVLISVRNSFANTPFGGFVTPIINQFIAAFGCAPS